MSTLTEAASELTWIAAGRWSSCGDHVSWSVMMSVMIGPGQWRVSQTLQNIIFVVQNVE